MTTLIKLLRTLNWPLVLFYILLYSCKGELICKNQNNSMRAVVQKVSGDPTTLEIGTIPIPEAGVRELLIKVQYAAINRMDLIQSKGNYPLPKGASPILGVEVSGTVVGIGSGCLLGFQIGDKVASLMTGGGYAEYCVVDERTVIKQFGSMNMLTLAAVPEAFMTAYQLCFVVDNIKPGESVLLHAAASSIGQAAIQLLRQKNVTVFCTVRSESKRLKCLELGANGAFNIGNSSQFNELIRNSNSGIGVHAVIDPVGGSYMEENLKSLEPDGRIVIYGLMGGAAVTDPTFLSKLMAKRITIRTSTLRARPIEYKENLIRLLTNDPQAFPALASGDIKVDVDKTFDISEVIQAHACVDRNENTGKVVLIVDKNV